MLDGIIEWIRWKVLMLGEERRNTELRVQEKLQAIRNCCEKFSGDPALSLKIRELIIL